MIKIKKIKHGYLIVSLLICLLLFCNIYMIFFLKKKDNLTREFHNQLINNRVTQNENKQHLSEHYNYEKVLNEILRERACDSVGSIIRTKDGRLGMMFFNEETNKKNILSNLMDINVVKERTDDFEIILVGDFNNKKMMDQAIGIIGKNYKSILLKEISYSDSKLDLEEPLFGVWEQDKGIGYIYKENKMYSRMKYFAEVLATKSINLKQSDF